MWPVAGLGSPVRSGSTRGLYRAAIKVGRKRQLSGWGEKNGTVHTNATITNTAETTDNKQRICSTKCQQRMPCPADGLEWPFWPPWPPWPP